MPLGNRPSARGFTVPELLVSIAVLVLISLAVIGDLTRIRYSEELQSSARLLAGGLRSLQARALAASSVQTCLGASVQELCEVSQGSCVGACDEAIPPYSLGMTLVTGASTIAQFAEVDISLNNRRQDGTESLGTFALLKGNAAAGFVTIESLTTNQGVVGNVAVTFERQSGAMRIDACDTPTPFTPACGGGGEPVSLTIVLAHARTGVTRTVRLNASTGKISLE